MLVSQSMIKTWRRCHKAYEYRYVQRLQKRKPELPLLRGTIIHECLDSLVSRKPYSRVLDKYSKEYNKLFEAEKEEYGNLIEEVTRVVDNYRMTYKNDGLKYTKGPDGKKYEIRVEADLAKGVTFQGHIDKLPVDRQGRLWIMDHKTHKVIPDEATRFTDLQTAVYMILLPLSGGSNPDGVLWDYIRTKPPTIPEQLKNGELTRRKNLDTDYNTYLGEITRLGLNPSDYTEELEKAKQNEKSFFQRVFLPKPNAIMLKQVHDDLVSTAKEIKSKPDTARNLTKDCAWCSYFNLCQAELRGLDAGFIRKSEYVELNEEEVR